MSRDHQHIESDLYTLDGASSLTVRAGLVSHERIVPPAGENYAFTAHHWPYLFQIAVSPKGRSVRLFVNGEEVDLRDFARLGRGR